MAAVELITAPWNLGLRPPAPGREPGTWRAPQALLSAGLEAHLRPARVVELDRPPYDFDAQPATRIRNGVTIREHALQLGEAVRATLAASRFAVVLGGDCSILLGCLLGARRLGRCGLVHLDGHSDFRHPGNHDTGSSLGSAAGMDLALATGRGELLLTHWPVVGRPLVADEDVVQIGDREESGETPPVTRFTAQEIQRIGIAALGERVIRRLERRELDRVWLHLDLDVLDERVLPAVDSPGRPGLDFSQLAELVSTLAATGRVVGLDVAIYDPELDPDSAYAAPLVDCLASALTPLATVETHA
ncbi:arginase family protein [Streptomyces solicathayae]|uniref:Arginase family protein n=1 Tax=Streptomyces solicathayae TaxID=3081768 RepID=A0ABZ0LUD5_9ACTN|nr:arginase family protein [Streptomyces sp. HUAS YS2]WOX23088.1 arginase family protein [Streptomyces sp. HUAS YS2]